MARRRKTSTAEDLVDIVSMLPWWAGVSLAAVSYVLLHRIAIRPMGTLSPDRMVSDGLTIGLAYAGQYALPFICLLGAAVSAWRRRERLALVEGVVAGESADVLNGMGWREFEMLVGEGFRLQGYRLAETGGDGPDGGVDLVLRKGGEKHLVQCKQWRAFKVGVTVVRELYGVMAASGAAGGFVVTSGRFTEEARAFAQGRNVQLLDGPALHQLVRAAKTAAADAAVPATDPTAARGAQRSMATPEVPACPRCAKPMTRRTAKKGPNAGESFWGCSGFPQCRGTA